MARLRAGDPVVAHKLWDQYFGHMVAVARKKLRGLSGSASDEEDVALSAFKSFCRVIESRRCDEAMAPDSLWTLLMALTVRKAVDLWRHETRLKRRPPNGPPETLVEAICPDRTPNWSPEWRTNARDSSACSVTRSCKPSRFGKWRASRTPRSPLN